jgi:hypothetical protein
MLEMQRLHVKHADDIHPSSRQVRIAILIEASVPRGWLVGRMLTSLTCKDEKYARAMTGKLCLCMAVIAEGVSGVAYVGAVNHGRCARC